MDNDLPHDTTANILSRLPIRSVLQCRCVCKTWCFIISEPRFANMHLNRATQTNPNIIIQSRPNTFRNELYFVEDNQEEFDEPIICATRIDVPFIESPFEVIGSCNGLLCLSSPHNRNHPIYIFNPATGHHSKLLELTIPTCVYSKSLFGFGFNVSTHEFKVLQVLFYKESSESQGLESLVQVYTLGSNSWRMIGNAPDTLSGHVSSSTFVNGSLHWIMIGPLQLDGRISFLSRISIVSFDLSVEEFGVVPKPEFREVVKRGGRSFLNCYGGDVRRVMNRGQHSFSNCYQLGVLGESLSVVDCSSDYSIDVWVMKNYNVKESWIKQFSFWRNSPSWLRQGFDMPVCLRKNGEILMVFDSKDLVSYNAESRILSLLEVAGIQKLSDLEAGGPPISFLAFPHVGSLVSPN